MSNVNKTLTMIKNYGYYWSSDTTNRLNDIALMQQALNNMGYSCGTADGIYGSGTVAGVKAFQTAKGLTSDGLFGAASLSKLETSLQRTLDKGTIYIGRVNDDDVAVRNKPSASGSTVYGRYPENMWCAARKVPGTTEWYATHWKNKTTVSGYIMSSFISGRVSKTSTKLCATAIATNLIGKRYSFFGFSSDGWCQSFCNIVLKVAGVNALQALLTSSNAKTTYDWFNTRNRIYSTPSVGDIVYFKWSGSSSDVDHAAIVTAVSSSTITICEGNRGNATERQYVRQHTESRSSSEILGYGRPKW